MQSHCRERANNVDLLSGANHVFDEEFVYDLVSPDQVGWEGIQAFEVAILRQPGRIILCVYVRVVRFRADEGAIGMAAKPYSRNSTSEHRIFE